MAMTVKSKKLYLVFALDSGKDYTVALPDPKPGLDSATVTPVMEAMVTNNFITVGTAVLASAKDAYIREISEDDLGV